MADNELRERRVGKEQGEVKKKERAARVYKIEKPEPTNWCLILTIVLIVCCILFILFDAFTGFKKLKYIFGYSK